MVMPYVLIFLSGLFASGTLVFTGLRQTVFCLWISGMALAGVFFLAGAKYIALSQAFIATVSMVILYFHTIQLHTEQKPTKRKRRLSYCFMALFAMGIMSIVRKMSVRDQGELFVNTINVSLRELGNVIIGKYLFETTLCCVFVFLVVIGLSYITRPEKVET